MFKQITQKGLTIILTATFLMVYSAGDSYANIPYLERAALIALYNATDGENWADNSGWRGNDNEADGFSAIGSEDEWYGIIVANDHVVAIYLSSNQLKGNIPIEIGGLSSLQTLKLDANQISGGIPEELGSLSNLLWLKLDDNQLSGSIPRELGNLPNVQMLELDENELNGSIPRELGNLSTLESLNIRKNHLSGSIPTPIGNLSNLTYLNLSFNQLSGNIPAELGNISSLQWLSLDGNQLSGSIPGELGKLSNLEYLSLKYNQLSGSIPFGIGNLLNIKYLAFSSNLLWGCIPTSIGNLVALNYLYIINNSLSGEIPEDLMNLTSLYDGESDFKNNHLYTTNVDLKNFLDLKQSGGDWESFQTLDTEIPRVEPLAFCGGYQPCFNSISDAISFYGMPSVIFVSEGEYFENISIESGFQLELGWSADFNCDSPTDPVTLYAPLPQP